MLGLFVVLDAGFRVMAASRSKKGFLNRGIERFAESA
jgi:hypothetical protein